MLVKDPFSLQAIYRAPNSKYLLVWVSISSNNSEFEWVKDLFWEFRSQSNYKPRIDRCISSPRLLIKMHHFLHFWRNASPTQPITLCPYLLNSTVLIFHLQSSNRTNFDLHSPHFDCNFIVKLIHYFKHFLHQTLNVSSRNSSSEFWVHSLV